jgi:hypothetical protein
MGDTINTNKEAKRVSLTKMMEVKRITPPSRQSRFSLESIFIPTDSTNANAHTPHTLEVHVTAKIAI